MSGTALSLLSLYGATKKQIYYEQAITIGLFIVDWREMTRTGVLREPDCPFSLFEGLGGAVLLWSEIRRAIEERDTFDGLVFPCFNDIARFAEINQIAKMTL
jgi:hypothetical protein